MADKNKKFSLKIVTPEGTAYEETIEQAVIPGSEGELGVLGKHSPVIMSLKEGLIKIFKTDSTKASKTFKTKGGIAEITEDSCVILSDSIK